MTARTIVVLGGALAGPTAAARAREIDDHARILLIERNAHASYAATALPFRLSGEIASDRDLDREGPDHFERLYDIEVRTGAEARALDPRKHAVELETTQGRETVRYDALVYALGVETRRPEVEGLDRGNVRPLRTLGDLEAVERAQAAGARRFAVIGGGTLGLEAIDGLVRGGAEVTLIESEERPLPRFGRAIRTLAQRALDGRVAMHLGAHVASASVAGDRVQSLRLSTGASVDVDFVVLAPGVRPRTELLRAAGVALREDGSVAVDERGRTAAADVFACGTCVAVPTQLGALTAALTPGQQVEPAWWPQAAIADKTAQVAGANAAGGIAWFAPFTGSMVARVLALTVARTGATADEAVAALGEDRVGRTVVHATAHEGILRDSPPLLVEILWERSTGALLGLEAAGDGAERRADVAAAAIAGRMSVDAIATLDLCYAPPFGAARDPLNVAATVAAAERAGLGRSVRSTSGRTVIDVDGRGASGAIALPLESLRERIAEIDPAQPLLVVDETGRRAWLAQRILAQRGVADVAMLAGGTRHAALEEAT